MYKWSEEEIVVTRDVIYGEVRGMELLLDIYNPPWNMEEGLRPAAVVIHGGGWKNQDKAGQIFVGMSMQYARMGLFTVSVDYRLSDEASAPAAVEDCKCAVRWLRAHADRYAVNPLLILAAGRSAGAHLALMLGESRDPALEGNGGWEEQSSAVSTVVAWFPITDVEDLIMPPNEREWAIDWIGGGKGEPRIMARLVSPIQYVSKESAPVLFIHGDSDEIVPYEHSVRMHQAMKQAGVVSELITVPGGGHGTWPKQSEWLVQTIEETHIRFLRGAGIL